MKQISTNRSLDILSIRHSPSTQRNLPSRTLPRPSLDDLPKINLLDDLGLDTRLLQRVLDDDGAQFGRGEGGEGTVE